MMQLYSDVLSSLSTHPLTHLCLTLVVFALSVKVFQRFKMRPIFNPVLLSMLVIMGVLTLIDVDYGTYFESVQVIHFLLGPATVALAVPLYRQLRQIKASAKAIFSGLLAGSFCAVASAFGLTYLLGGSVDSIASIIPKSVTSPIAMGISEQIAGIPSLSAAIVIITGVIGVIMSGLLFKLFGIHDWAVKGVAMGTACHGVGTASMMLANEKAGAFAGLAMGINGFISAILIPIAWVMLA